RPEQRNELALRDVERDAVDRGRRAEPLGQPVEDDPRHQTIRLSLTKRSLISIAVPISTICTNETAAIVGSRLNSRYCRIAIGSVVRPGPTRNSDISRFSNETMKLNSAAATMPARIIGSVIRRNTVQRLAPRFSAAS